MFWIWYACQPLPPVELESEVVDIRPDILLITIDTLRADRLGTYGDTLAKTPNLDRLAAEGWLYTESHAITPLTLPSHTSILTGLLPREHGVRDNAGFSLDERHQTIAESLSESGYATGAFISAYVLSHSWGLDQGFDVYHDPFHPRDLLEVAAFGEAQLPAGEVLNVAKQWWRKQSSETPKFSWVHLYDPHTPWDPPADWKGDPYRGEISKVDHLLGDVLALAEDAWVIVTSDHGEGLWEHGEREHGVLLGRGVTRVPLIIRPPGGEKGNMSKPQPEVNLAIERPEGVDESLSLGPITGDIRAAKIIETPVSSIDLAPTIADISGVTFKSSGESLFQDRVRNTTYAETFFPLYHYGWHPLSMIQDSTQRIEQGTRTESVDPWTLHSVSPNPSLLQELLEFRGTIEPPSPADLSATQAAALQALGYQTDFVRATFELETAEDPRDSVGLLREIYTAERLPIEQAIPALETIVRENPQLLSPQLTIVYLESARGNIEVAFERCIDVLRQDPEHSLALNNAVILSYKLKKYDMAIAFANSMRELNANDVRPYRYLTAIYAEQESTEQVIEIAGKGLEIEPNDPNLNYLKGLAHVFLTQDEDGIIHLQRAKENKSRASDISLWLGIAAERLENIDEALRHYEQAAKDMPLDPRANAKAGMMLAEKGRPLLINVAGRLRRPDPSIQLAIQQCSTE